MNKIDRRALLRTVGAGLLAPATVPRPARGQTTVNLSMWAWTLKMQLEIDLFEKANPDIKVQWVNAGQGLAQYAKMRTALKAGIGMPDVVQVTYQMIPSFQIVDALVDLTPYGADKLRDTFVAFAWQQSSVKGGVYGIPWDSGPVGLIYRQDLFDKYRITPPATWDEFAETAARLNSDAPDVFLTNTMLNNAAWMWGSMWQAGSRPFEVDGQNVRISVNNEAARKWAAYWQRLIETKVVEARPAFTTEWYTAYDLGRYATWFIAAWGPAFLSQFAKNSAGRWRVAPPPLWQAGNYVSANMGGSTLAVSKQSKYPEQAAKLAIWLMTDPGSVETFVKQQFLFPTRRDLLEKPQFADITSDFYGGQKINQVYIESSRHVGEAIQWSPFEDFADQQLQNEMSAAGAGKGTLVEALDRVQAILVKYARGQGFTVRT
jgi:multiple sugar transport system substrate-binding protein